MRVYPVRTRAAKCEWHSALPWWRPHHSNRGMYGQRVSVQDRLPCGKPLVEQGPHQSRSGMSPLSKVSMRSGLRGRRKCPLGIPRPQIAESRRSLTAFVEARAFNSLASRYSVSRYARRTSLASTSHAAAISSGSSIPAVALTTINEPSAVADPKNP
jgi:hypothetical protein